MAATGREFFTVKTVSEALADFRPRHSTAVEIVRAGRRASDGCPPQDRPPRDALPGFDRSSVDGYAVRARGHLRRVRDDPGVPARRRRGPRWAPRPRTARLRRRRCDPDRGRCCPIGADAIVMVEHTAGGDAADTIEVVRPVAPGENVVRLDEDVGSGRLARAARAVRSGRRTWRCWRRAGVARSPSMPRPRVTILATGDEVVATGHGAICAGAGPGRAQRFGQRAHPRGGRRLRHRR